MIMASVLCVAGMLLGGQVMAAGAAASPVPDLTKGEKRDSIPDWNLGPTGAKGWVFGRGFDTSEARQLLVTEVEKGSPAAGELSADDVILGVNGKAFESDARVALGQAVTEAEKDANKGALKLLRWRNGKQKEVTVPLKVMCSYSGTSPYDCPKAKLIAEQGCRAIMKRGIGNDQDHQIVGSLNALALLASGNPEYLDTVKVYAHKIGPPDLKLNTYESSIKGDLPTWSWGYANLFLTEYYLATKDEYVLPAIREYAVKMATGQSEIGTWGHGFRLPGNYLGGYGAVNQPGLICWMSLVLAQKCGSSEKFVPNCHSASTNLLGVLPVRRAWSGASSVGASCL
jgi:hypothetical protein